jgi:hypothetical protein
MDAVLIENTIYATAPAQGRSSFSVKIWPPVPHPEGDFVCRVGMSHKPRPIEVGGVDPLQSLALAIAYLNAEFRSLLRAGWTFYFEESDDEPFDPSTTYFPPSTWESAA